MFVVYSFAINSLLYADEEQAQKGDCTRQVQDESQQDDLLAQRDAKWLIFALKMYFISVEAETDTT